MTNQSTHDQSRLDLLARLAGIADGYTGPDGNEVPTSRQTREKLLAALGLPLEPTPEQSPDPALAGTPPVLRHSGTGRCFSPDWLAASPVWGVTCQLYELRSRRNWGIGDFEDLAALAEIVAAEGGDFIGITPLHALFLADPERCSPFSPSNRRHLNPLYIAVDEVPGFDAGAVEAHRLEELGRRDIVDYAAVADTKRVALLRLWNIWRSGTAPAELRDEFVRFRETSGEELQRHALFEALSAHMTANGYGAGWTAWPEEYRHPRSSTCNRFAREHADEVGFHAWLQWLADRQLAHAADRVRAAGMRIGLYLDLAVGDVPDGSAVWSTQDMYVQGATIGAPPDYFSNSGQEWGVVALSPVALARDNQAFLTAMLESAARHAGAMRIDHVMSLWQLFLVPDGDPPSEGAHVRYHVADALDRLAALSQERRLIVIGEDLGYVPPGFRHVMREANLLSYRIVYFEKDGNGSFLPADAYPEQSIACLSTHDLPTLAGWWAGNDIDLRLEHGLIDRDSADDQRAERERERIELCRLAGIRPDHDAPMKSGPPPGLAVGLHAFLADTPAWMAGARLADLVGESLPTNLPGTIGAYPNWRRRLHVDVADLPHLPGFRSVTGVLRQKRPRR